MPTIKAMLSTPHLMNHKFADPAIEAIRERAARSWMKVRPDVYKGLGGLLNAAQQAPGIPVGPGVPGVPVPTMKPGGLGLYN